MHAGSMPRTYSMTQQRGIANATMRRNSECIDRLETEAPPDPFVSFENTPIAALARPLVMRTHMETARMRVHPPLQATFRDGLGTRHEKDGADGPLEVL